MPTPPFPPGPGQAVGWAYPKTADWGTDGGPGTTNPFGTSTSTVSDGKVQMFQSCGLCNYTYWARWYNFTAALPTNTTGITALYGVMQAKEWDPTSNFNHSYEGSGANFLINPGNISLSGHSFNGPGSNTSEPSAYTTIWTASLGSSLADLASASLCYRFFQTLAIIGNGTVLIQTPAIAVYYDAPVMPIGHACNANAYDPITVNNGMTTAPGNGILSTVD